MEAVESGIGLAVPDVTERRSLLLSRVGQGQFREGVSKVWGGRCAVTGLDIVALLRASHIKPWRDSDNRERLDPYNGLFLSPAYDATFDAGMISFGDDGAVIISDDLGQPTRDSWDRRDCTSGGLDDRHLAYLNHHRENVFSDRGTS